MTVRAFVCFFRHGWRVRVSFGNQEQSAEILGRSRASTLIALAISFHEDTMRYCQAPESIRQRKLSMISWGQKKRILQIDRKQYQVLLFVASCVRACTHVPWTRIVCIIKAVWGAVSVCPFTTKQADDAIMKQTAGHNGPAREPHYHHHCLQRRLACTSDMSR